MILTLLDKTEMFVNDIEGAAIRQALTKSETGFLTVRGVTVKKSGIMKLEEGGSEPKTVSFFDDDKALPEPTAPKCHGQFSIQREINNIIRHEHPTEWAKLICDKAFRERIRRQLRESDAEWCDYKANECACEAGSSV